MSNSIGYNIKVTIFGASHHDYVGIVVNGFPKGLKVDYEFINDQLKKRRPEGEISTSRIELDDYTIEGLESDTTTGDEITIKVSNKNINSSDYEKGVCRPGHADYVSYQKYGDKYDYRGGGQSSGRMTTPLVILGALCKQYLKQYNIQISSHISSIHGVYDDNFDYKNIESQFDYLNSKQFAVINKNAEQNMIKEIELAKANNDSVGGELETVVLNPQIGLGEPYFDSLESYISHLLFSIGGIKGISFGDGPKFATQYGSESNDQMMFDGNKNVNFLSNHNGGINGGVSNGSPIIVKTIIKPTSSISKTQQSINLETKENISLNVKGRHDPCIVHRVRIVQESLIAFALLDMLISKEK